MSTPKKTTAPAAQVTYRDSRNTSRALILPKDRQLAVVRAQVTVSADDAEALTYLDAHPDFTRLQE